MTTRVLLIQLARLGDLVQSIPAMTGVKECHPDWELDLLCPASLEGLGRMLPGVSTVIPWDGVEWHRRARRVEAELQPEDLEEADQELHRLTREPYDYAILLNQHERAVFAGALLAQQLIGTVTTASLDHQLSPWAQYVKSVAARRRDNRIHLSDAFCGMCGVLPPQHVPILGASFQQLPGDLEPIGRSAGPWIGLLVGAGEPERVIPRAVWAQFAADSLGQLPSSRIVLIGQAHESAKVEWIQSSLPSSLVGRVWDTTGRLSLSELAVVLTRCQVVVGADTGPLHVATAVGTPVIGWYFARARVHETGPYGPGHRVWQAEGTEGSESGMIQPTCWPIAETIAALRDHVPGSPEGWSLWNSHRDQWGAYYVEADRDPVAPIQREQVWRELQLSAA